MSEPTSIKRQKNERICDAARRYALAHQAYWGHPKGVDGTQEEWEAMEDARGELLRLSRCAEPAPLTPYGIERLNTSMSDWTTILWEAAKRSGLNKRVSLYDLRTMSEAVRTLAPSGRTAVEMDSAEYDRMRAALGETWEWEGDVSIRVGAAK